MDDMKISSVGLRLFYSLGTLLLTIFLLAMGIITFLSYGPGPSLGRGLTGIALLIISFIFIWYTLVGYRSAVTTMAGITAGMFSWMAIGEAAPQFGFPELETEIGLVLLVFFSVIALFLALKGKLPFAFMVFLSAFLMNWGGHAILFTQDFLGQALDMVPAFQQSYFITGVVFIAAAVWLVIVIIRKPATKTRLMYYGFLFYFFLVVGIEGVTRISSTFV
jgi:hypothetical protein